ncbi:hypothetical protein [Amycolatopsis sp. H20-H5]|uniref:hypothetical protein n=1 Tax=Amycolatopsis sp. H20-H5 TaxID=3046309 RepID=UPI002DBB22A4|nr:hypothetical protein [Amycolatopsis sp. H20-H5]MEC3974744.1 hypothetical protein [Amycolatopsis sp. H20-H5]
MTRRPDPRDLIRQHDEAALTAENKAVADVTGPLDTAFTALWRWLLGLWARLFGKPSTRADGDQLQSLVEQLTTRLVGIGIDPVDALLHHAQRARLLGADQGAREAGFPVVPDPGPVADRTREAVVKAVRHAREKLESGAADLAQLREASLAEVLRRASVARQASAILAKTARTTFNDELNAGIRVAAKAAGARLVWVAERDACVQCLALSGQVIDVDGEFDWRRTFGKKAYKPPGPLLGPPRHPNCRCRLTPWFGHDTEGAVSVTHDWAGAIADAKANNDPVAEAAARKAAAAARDSAAFDLPAALRREAERSILNGYALPSESESVRVQAADKLLARIGQQKNAPAPSGWRVPASVKKRAERALTKGTFTTRSVPTGRK